MHTSLHVRFLVAVICCTIIFSSCGPKSNDPETRSNGRAARLVVNGVVVRPQSLDNIVRSSGTVLASESVDLVAESAGRIEKISFQEGGHVKKNDILVQINDDDLQAQLKKVELQIQLSADQENVNACCSKRMRSARSSTTSPSIRSTRSRPTATIFSPR